MTIASLLNFTDQRDFSTFSFANADHHQLMVRVLNSLGQDLTTYVLDPIPETDSLNWLRRHQQAHNDINTVLGVQGADLTSVNFRDKEERESWSELHFDEHFQWLIQTGVD